MYGRFAAGPVSVRRDANAPADCTHEKSLQMQVFQRAAEGIRTHDLLHGKQNVQRRSRTNIPAKAQRHGTRGHQGFPAFTGKSRGFGYRWVPERALVRGWRVRGRDPTIMSRARCCEPRPSPAARAHESLRTRRGCDRDARGRLTGLCAPVQTPGGRRSRAGDAADQCPFDNAALTTSGGPLHCGGSYLGERNAQVCRVAAVARRCY
jgi:hypothetical protein